MRPVLEPVFLPMLLWSCSALGPDTLGVGVARAEQRVDVSFTLAESSVTLHEPVYVDFTIQNDFGEEIQFDLGFDRLGSFTFSITDPTGWRRQVRVQPREGMARTGTLSLGGGQTFKQRILMNELYQFPRVGDYVIEARMTGAILTRSGGKLEAPPAKPMTLSVLPRNLARLEEVCQDLVKDATSSDADRALTSARALSWVDDLVAVPYLEEVAGRATFNEVTKPIAIRGLTRVALSQGKHAVFSRMKDRSLQSEVSAVMPRVGPR